MVGDDWMERWMEPSLGAEATRQALIDRPAQTQQAGD
jgi:hypothetical protein